MGFESKISGYIGSHLTDQESVKQIEEQIRKLPNLENDEWPFLPKDIFSISKPISVIANPVQISYRSTMIHFSMSVKQIEGELKEWLTKFESFFKQIPGVYEANIDVFLSPFTDVYKNGNLNYHWKANINQNGSKDWKFRGDPTELEEICKPMNFAHSYFTKELRDQVLENLQWLEKQNGKTILITDMITTFRGNYDRHFTRKNSFEFVMTHFGVRTSGAIGMIEGERINFEFKTDCIRRIEKYDNELEIESVLDLNTSRLINIKTK